MTEQRSEAAVVDLFRDKPESGVFGSWWGGGVVSDTIFDLWQGCKPGVYTNRLCLWNCWGLSSVYLISNPSKKNQQN